MLVLIFTLEAKKQPWMMIYENISSHDASAITWLKCDCVHLLVQ